MGRADRGGGVTAARAFTNVNAVFHAAAALPVESVTTADGFRFVRQPDGSYTDGDLWFATLSELLWAVS